MREFGRPTIEKCVSDQTRGQSTTPPNRLVANGNDGMTTASVAYRNSRGRFLATANLLLICSKRVEGRKSRQSGPLLRDFYVSQVS